ncbi:MAG: thioesterase family protein [Planctomycetota bacterium]|nr:thioesterase family protein [Planctomycetota bacterium]
MFETAIRLQHTDAAGVVFFARYFELAHAAYEDLLDALGQSLPGNLGSAALLYPIVHAEANYRAMVRMGDRVRIEVTVSEVKSRSFALDYRFATPHGEEIAVLKTVHVAVDRATGRSTRLPDDLAAALGGAGRLD